jgi:hypothetical protein
MRVPGYTIKYFFRLGKELFLRYLKILIHSVLTLKFNNADIAIVCKNNLGSVQEVFSEYERLTRKSGLELNADKTEILRIGHLNEHEVLLSINYMGKVYKIRNVDQMKICRLYFCNDP